MLCLYPQYEKAASILSTHEPAVVLAKVDANEEQNKDLASEYDVKGFPTIKILRNGGKNIQEYKGPREAEGIVEYLKKQSGPASTEIKSADDATAFVGDNKVVIVSIQPLWFNLRIKFVYTVKSFILRCIKIKLLISSFNDFRSEFSLNFLERSTITSLH